MFAIWICQKEYYTSQSYSTHLATHPSIHPSFHLPTHSPIQPSVGEKLSACYASPCYELEFGGEPDRHFTCPLRASNEAHRQLNKQLPAVSYEPAPLSDTSHSPPPRNWEQRAEIQSSMSQDNRQMPRANLNLAITKVIPTQEIILRAAVRQLPKAGKWYTCDDPHGSSCP